MATATLTSETPFRNPTRQLTSVLAPLEKRCLVWLASKLPSWVNSDHLTGLALTSMMSAGFCYAMAQATQLGLVGGIVSLAINWFGDSLDGTLARVRRHERPRYGFYVDHVVDAIGVACLLGGLGLSGYMSPIVAAGVFGAYMLLCSEIFLRTCATGTFRMSFLRIGPTELRILLSIGTLAVMRYPTAHVFGHTALTFDVAGVIAIAGLVGMFLVSAWDGVRTLYRAEPLPR